ncbi:endo alpha-1,4 polygalactosaminidase [Aspergillus undulatus]|uniref:endo alpha-1,4 polygalactosaminidase n=1 Tax=Aspergillus undulatus TaxID=1810928 RepID=UPI003CCD5F69
MQSAFTFILALAALSNAHPLGFPLSAHRRINGTSINPNTTTEIWQPTIGATWQIILHGAVPASSLSNPTASIYDIDVFENPTSTITSLHNAGRRVICYFSAGTREDWREDADQFDDADLGSDLDDWDGEKWVDLRSENVRSIMRKRLDIAKQKGCDAVDPDNVDAYGNEEGGLGLTEDDTVDFMNWLAGEAHARGLAIGLKNAGAIIPRVLENMQFSVNEQCSVYDECDVYMPFVDAGKAVFQIEYPKGDDVNDEMEVSGMKKESVCSGYEGEGSFSTLIKNMDLDEWVQIC